jgi:replicative superfamily II helicase
VIIVIFVLNAVNLVHSRYCLTQTILSHTSHRKITEEENVLSFLVSDGLSRGQQILVFCPSKLNCSQLCAVLLRTLCPELGGKHTVRGDSSASSATVVNGDSRRKVKEGSEKSAEGDWERKDRAFISHQRYRTDGGHNNSNNSNNNNNNNNKKKEALKKKIQDDRAQIISNILTKSPQADPSLLGFVESGFAFHHAGLSMEERAAVEMAFTDGKDLWTDPLILTLLFIVLLCV